MIRSVIFTLAIILLAHVSLADDRQSDIGIPGLFTNTTNVEYQALKKVMTDDDQALSDVSQWIQENQAYAAQGAGETKDDLNKRILDRLHGIRDEYLNFLNQYTNCAPGYLAYGSFLYDTGDEVGAAAQYEKSRQLDPSNPAVWNNLANFYGENSPVTNAFAYYAKAIELDPLEPIYYENFATTVYLFRKDAREFYGINESQVFDKSLALYRKAIALDPQNFTLRTDYADSFYGIKPLRTNDALEAWTNALGVAQNDLDREGVYIHLARVKIAAGRYVEAQAQLDEVTNAVYAALKTRLHRSLIRHQNGETNSLDTPMTAPISTNRSTAAISIPGAAPAPKSGN